MAIGTLYISHKNFDFSSLDSSSLTSDNLKEVIKSKTVNNYHTSLEDCDIKIEDIGKQLLDHVQKIIPLDLVGNTKENTNVYVNLAYQIIKDYSDRCKDIDHLMDTIVYGQFNYHYNFEEVLPVTDKKKLWIAGCSFSSLERPSWTEVYKQTREIQYVENHERWAYIVSQELDLEEVNIAFPGAGIYDGLRRIIESEAKDGDKLIWQITCETRETAVYPYMGNYIGSLDQTLNNMMHIHLGIEYCKKQGIDLYIVNMLADDTWVSRFCQNSKYLNLYRVNLIDFGSDNLHPGPKQNAEYAKEIIKFIQGR